MSLTVIIALVVAFSGCSHMMNSGKVTTDSASQQVANDKYAKEILELGQVIRNDSKSAEAKNAHLKLAHLYLDHNNHRRNYQRALKHLKSYNSGGIFRRWRNAKLDGVIKRNRPSFETDCLTASAN